MAPGIAADLAHLVGTVSGPQIPDLGRTLIMGGVPLQGSIVTGNKQEVKRKTTRSIAAIFGNPRNVSDVAAATSTTMWKRPWDEREHKLWVVSVQTHSHDPQ